MMVFFLFHCGQIRHISKWQTFFSVHIVKEVVRIEKPSDYEIFDNKTATIRFEFLKDILMLKKQSGSFHIEIVVREEGNVPSHLMVVVKV